MDAYPYPGNPPGGSTQDEVLAVSLAKLALTGREVVVEIGSGSGKVTSALARAARIVLSVDRNPMAVTAARVRTIAEGCTNIEFFQGEATGFLADHGPFDAAFVGGSRDLPMVLGLLEEKVNGPIVVHAVLLSTMETAVRTMTDLGIFREAVQVQISRAHPLAGSVMFRPQDPVTIIVGET
ncbi:MAG: methyltransferase domain-containing protein [Methanomicrobiales archaeon]|nr:methyltransferase domain-containing protein [Methanomicrobiales archaeon]